MMDDSSVTAMQLDSESDTATAYTPVYTELLPRSGDVPTGETNDQSPFINRGNESLHRSSVNGRSAENGAVETSEDLRRILHSYEDQSVHIVYINPQAVIHEVLSTERTLLSLKSSKIEVFLSGLPASHLLEISPIWLPRQYNLAKSVYEKEAAFIAQHIVSSALALMRRRQTDRNLSNLKERLDTLISRSSNNDDVELALTPSLLVGMTPMLVKIDNEVDLATVTISMTFRTRKHSRQVSQYTTACLEKLTFRSTRHLYSGSSNGKRAKLRPISSDVAIAIRRICMIAAGSQNTVVKEYYAKIIDATVHEQVKRFFMRNRGYRQLHLSNGTWTSNEENPVNNLDKDFCDSTDSRKRNPSELKKPTKWIHQ